MKIRYYILTFIILVVLTGATWYKTTPALGDDLNEKEMKKYNTSQNFKNGVFQNQEETPVMNSEVSTWKIMMEFMKKGENRTPEKVLPTVAFNNAEFEKSTSGIKATWFGHSTVLFKLNGLTIITDPVFSKHASPLGFTGNKSFDFENETQVSDLPEIDVVLISHDHYDHLDYKTIKQLTGKTKAFIVPLGVSAHLIKWKVPESKIIELDWYNNHNINGVEFVCTPARHFSGRSLKRNTTLWCSYVIKTDSTSVYFGGDSGYGKHFKEIGDKYGPFYLTMLECGQYNEGWPFIHTLPNEIPQAFTDLKGKRLLPLHWGKFKLSLHPWTEPVDKLITFMNGQHEALLTPEINKTINIDKSCINNYWW